MPSILHSDDRVQWIAGKNFTYNGTKYQVGDEVPDINEFPRLEVFVRTRHVIPVVDSKDDLPFQFRHVAMTRERAQQKLGLGHRQGGSISGTPKPIREVANSDNATGFAQERTEVQTPPSDSDEFDPADHDIDGVMEYVEENPDEVLSVYALEEEGKNRKTLLTKLDKILNEQAEAENKENTNE